MANTNKNPIDPTSPSVAKEVVDPIYKEFARLGSALKIGAPSDKIHIPGVEKPYQLTPQEYNAYKKQAGDKALERIGKALADPALRPWYLYGVDPKTLEPDTNKPLTKAEQAAIIKDIIEDELQTARNTWMPVWRQNAEAEATQ